MRGKWLNRTIIVVVATMAVGAMVYALLPRPEAVDLAAVDRGPLSVTVSEDGLARIRDVFQVSTPVAGRLGRTSLKVGDAVRATESVIAAIYPAAPPFLDARSQAELAGAVEAAAAGVRSAEAEVAQAEAAQRLANAALARAQSLARTGDLPDATLQSADTAAATAAAAVTQARALLAGRRSESEAAQARLMQPSQVPPDLNPGLWVTIPSPVTGVVLKLPVKDEQVVPAGTVIALVGDPKALELVVPLLSRDAVALRPGGAATVGDWGGPALPASVRAIDPIAFTKTSALGIEEQRVNVTLDLAGPPERWAGLGHEYRVSVAVELWSSPDVVRVPLGALFRAGGSWAVFKVENGRARQAAITIAHRTNTTAEVVSGLTPGDQVVLHPSDRIADGSRVLAREQGGP
ncbi:MAG: HlyD family efflux transporter periplasmic adaptor subunit [Bauldia sp.]|mgnify:CR=1 FL=1